MCTPGQNRHLPVMRALATLLLVCWSIACKPQAADSVAYGHGAAHPDCGPADGPAVRVALSHTLVGDGPHVVPAPPSLTLMVFASVGRALRGEVSIDPAGRGRSMTGSAEYCTADGRCDRAVAGWIRFRELVSPANGDTVLTGRYQIELSDGTGESGGFRARWIRWAPLCG